MNSILPEEIVANISSYNGKIYNKYSRVECRDTILTQRRKYANKLRRALVEFYIDDIDDMKRQNKNGKYDPVSVEKVLESTQPEIMLDTLITMSSCLAFEAGWPELMCDFWSFNDYSIGYYRPTPYIRSELWFKRLEREHSYNYSFMLAVLTQPPNTQVNLWNFNRDFLYLNPYI